MEASVTTTAMSNPRVSTRIWYLRPFTFFLRRSLAHRTQASFSHSGYLKLLQLDVYGDRHVIAPGHEGVVKPLPRSIIAPLLEIAIHALPAGILTRQHSPFAASNHEIEDGIHHISHLQRAWMSSWLCSGN